MRTLQVFDRDALGQRAGTGNLQAVVIDGYAHRSALGRIAPVAERIGERLAEGLRRVERIVFALVDIREDATGDGQMIAEEALCTLKEIEAHIKSVVNLHATHALQDFGADFVVVEGKLKHSHVPG